MNTDDWWRRKTDEALLAGPLGEGPSGPPPGPGAYMAGEPFPTAAHDAYDIVQAVLLSLWREVSVREYRDMQQPARDRYHVRMAEYFRTRAAGEPRLATYFIARAVLHDQCAKVAVPKREGLGGQLAENFNHNVILEVLGLVNPLP